MTPPDRLRIAPAAAVSRTPSPQQEGWIERLSTDPSDLVQLRARRAALLGDQLTQDARRRVAARGMESDAEWAGDQARLVLERLEGSGSGAPPGAEGRGGWRA